MIWIKNIKIQNFESHKDTYVEFSPGFNILTGSSNSGKSSLIRAIIWVCFNEPSSNKFVRKDYDSIQSQKSDKKRKQHNIASVEIELSNGYKVIRRRSGNQDSTGGSANKYILINPDVGETTYNQFGYDVPDEIKEVLGFGSVLIGGKKNIVNYLAQFEPPRALTYQGNALSGIISKLNNLDLFEEALSVFNSRIHHHGEFPTKEKIYAEEYARLTNEIEFFPDVSEKINLIENIIIPKIERNEELERKISIAKKILIEAEYLKNRYSIVNNEIKKLNKFVSVETKLQYVDLLISKMELSNTIIIQIDKINKNLKNIDNSINSNQTKYNLNINKYEKIINILEKYEKYKKTISNINDEEKSIENKINEFKKSKNDDINNMKLYIYKYFNQNNQCPLCDHQLGDKDYEHIAYHLGEE